jgi:hypothetical protein
MFRAVLMAGALALAAAGAAEAQVPKPVTTYKAPRSADGKPSLEGVWTNASLTRLERNPRYGKDLVLTADEVAKAEGANKKILEVAARPTDPNASVIDLPADCSGGRGTNCNYNAQWTDPGETIMRVNGQPRNGFITFPADGRVPMKAGVGGGFGGRRMPPGVGQNDNPETRSLGERCLLSFGNSSGPVMLPSLYNNTYQIVQTKDHVSIVVEMVHDTRIVRLNAKHLPASQRPWMGDSIGWWEGETLVVETTNFHPAQSFRGASENLKVTERFTAVGPGRLHYAFQVEDPTVFAQPWGGEYEFSRLKDNQLYEYACHEGNYGLANILSGARHEEKTGVKTAPTNVDQRAAQGDEEDEGGN